MASPASLQLPDVRLLAIPQLLFQLQTDRVDVWFRNALYGNDQRRKRVAFAFSEILIVSQLDALVEYPYSLTDYNDVLVRNAFAISGN